MKKLLLGVLFMMVVMTSWAQMASETYTTGDIPSTYNTAPTNTSIADQPGILTVNIPAGATITGVDVVYSFESLGGGWMSEQRSYMKCTSPGGTAETQIYSGSGTSSGVMNYSRTGLNIANNVTSNEVTFELHPFRTWGTDPPTGLNYGKVNNNTWTVTVHYNLAGAPGTPSNPNPSHAASGVALNTGLSWTNGADTDNVQVLFGNTNPPTNEVYDGPALTSLTNAQIGGNLSALTTYYWRVIGSNDDYTTPGPVWSFMTGWDDGAYQIGFGTINNTNLTYPAPYGNWYNGSRQQMLIPASELQAAGMVAPGFIESLAFDVVTPQATPLNNFTVKIRTTTLTTLTAFTFDNLTTVWGPATYTDTNGWNNHSFITPFFWDGTSNLLIETSFENTSYTGNAVFNQTATAGYVSTITYRQDTGYNYDNPTLDISSEQRPNMVFAFEMTNTGTLDGHVNDGVSANPIVNAIVQIVDSPYSTTTNDQGYFVFPTVQEGTYSVRATKHGYTEQIIENVVITEDETTTVTLNISMLDTVAVSGRVVGSDFPDIGLENATISLAGYQPYETTTNATGHFTIADVFSGHTYTMTITHQTYQTHVQEIVVGNEDLLLGDVIVEEIAFPAHSVVAQVTDNNDVHIEWGEPGTQQPDLIMIRQHSNEDADAYYQSYGNGYGVVFDLGTYPGATLENIDFRHSPWGIMGTWSFNVHIIDWSNYSTIATVGPFSTAVNDGWETDVDLGSIAGTNGLVGVLIEPLSNSPTDAYPCIDGDGDLDGYSIVAPLANISGYSESIVGDFLIDLWILFAGREELVQLERVNMRQLPSRPEKDATTLSTFTTSQSNIHRARVNSNTTASLANGGFQFAERSSSTPSFRNVRALEGYVLYRFLSANQGNESLWSEIATITNPAVTEFVDTDWSDLDPGVYRYAVRAMYTNNVLSNPAFSNNVENSMSAFVTVTLTTNSGDPVTGATVTLSNIDGDPNHVYSATSPASGILVFPNVWRGTYIVTAQMVGFADYQANNVLIVDDTFMYPIELVELLLPIVDLQHQIHNGNNVLLEWLAPGSSTGTEQWIHWDSGLNNDAIGTGGAAQFSVAQRFTPGNLENLNVGGLYLTSIRFWPHEPTATYTLKVWRGGSTSPWNAGDEVHSQAVPTFTVDSWNEVALSNPVFIDSTQELWFGYAVNTPTGYPAGCDSGPAINGYGNMMYWNDEWNTLLGIAPTLNYNWNLQAYAGAGRGDSSVELSKSRANHFEREESAVRALLGYKIVRNETVLAEQHTALSYTDSNVPNGTYYYSVIAQYTTGESEAIMTEQITILDVDNHTVVPPLTTELRSNYPNPFNPVTNISFSLREADVVTIEIYNVRGQKIRTLINEELGAGNHVVSWNGLNDHNREVGSGIFFYRMKSGNYSSTRKMIMMK